MHRPGFLIRSFLSLTVKGMFDLSPFERVRAEEVETILTEAIQSSAGGQMTRNAEVFLAGVCAKHLTEHLLLAGLVFMRRAD